MTYTIIRPGGLKNEAGTGQGVLTEDNTVCGAIHREDVADLIVKALFSKETDGKVSCHILCPFLGTRCTLQFQVNCAFSYREAALFNACFCCDRLNSQA